jgi:hypothetical protein
MPDAGRHNSQILRQPGHTLTADQRRFAHRAALALALLCLLAMLPEFGHLQLAAAPGWARALLLGSMVQMAFVAWMATIPDRGSMWVLMIVLALAATIYGAVAGIALGTSLEFELPLGLARIRWPAFWWSTAMMALQAVAAFFCGQTAQRWTQRVGEPEE